jgi:U3 small nucleolar RNA-associated protein 7
LTYVDISIGKKVAGYSTAHGRCDIMKQNPSNAIINLGHSSGVVTMWSPNVKEPLVKMLCHKSPIKSLAVSHDGKYMATSGLDHLLNIWDLRTYKQLNSIRLKDTLSGLDISQKGLIGASFKNNVEIYKDFMNESNSKTSYLTHSLKENVQNIQFCPYEDVLGIGHSQGISSILVPGAGEPNFDALEANPYETKNQRKQWEVKALLEKIQPELISLDPMKLREIDEKTLEEKMIENNKLAVSLY